MVRSPTGRRRRRGDRGVAKRTLTIGGKSGAKKPAPREPDGRTIISTKKPERRGFGFSNVSAQMPDRCRKAVMRANRDWLLETNGPGEDGEDDGDIERVWTRGLMDYAAAHARHWPDDTRQALVFDVLTAFSDEAFIDAAAAFIVQSDLRLIEGDAEDRAYLLSVREALWPRLKQTWHWRSHLWSTRDGMEIHLKELISAFFMRATYGFGDGQAYTKGLSDP